MGDLRLGIDLLRMSGNNAEIRASRQISDEDVKRAMKTAENKTLDYILQGLSDREKHMIWFINNLGEKNLTSGKLYEEYNMKYPISYSTYNRLINKLEFLRLLDTTYTGSGKKGNSRYVTLRFNKEQINECIEDEITI